MSKVSYRWVISDTVPFDALAAQQLSHKPYRHLIRTKACSTAYMDLGTGGNVQECGVDIAPVVIDLAALPDDCAADGVCSGQTLGFCGRSGHAGMSIAAGVGYHRSIPDSHSIPLQRYVFSRYSCKVLVTGVIHQLGDGSDHDPACKYRQFVDGAVS